MKNIITEKDIIQLNDKLLQSSLDPQDEEDDCYMVDRKTITKLIILVSEYDYIMNILNNVDEDYLYKNHSALWSKIKEYKEEK